MAKYLLAAALVALSVASAAAQQTWHMPPVKVTLARATGQKPTFEGGAWHTQYPLSSVNAASVEGALKYVHTETIDYREVKAECKRKNDANFIIFFELTFANPNATLAFYQDHQVSLGEFGQYVTMDSGACHSQSECLQFYGDAKTETPPLGPYIGIQKDDNDDRAPYPGNWWYSMVAECPLKAWWEKTEECMEEFPGGFCPQGVTPDGIRCTWSYTLLGYASVDDIVGITSMMNPKTGKHYKNYLEFCEEGGVEFERGPDNEMVRGLPFWDNPLDPEANVNRSMHMVEVYHNTTLYPNNVPLPDPADYRAVNPKCYETLQVCDPLQTTGCYRDNSQVCRKCKASGNEHDIPCEVTPAGFTPLPTLSVPAAPTLAPGDDGGSGNGGGGGGSGGDGGGKNGGDGTGANEDEEGGGGDSDSGLSSGAIIGIIVGAAAFVGLAVVGVMAYKKKKAGEDDDGKAPLLDDQESPYQPM